MDGRWQLETVVKGVKEVYARIRLQKASGRRATSWVTEAVY